MMEAAGYNETSVPIYQTTQGYTEPVDVVETILIRTREIFGSDLGR